MTNAESPRRIVLASPIEPSGASWLLNCLVELGIRVEHRAAGARLYRRRAEREAPSIWNREGEAWRLDRRAQVMGKWMPSLMMHDSFRFREDVFVEYLQDWPRPEHRSDTVALFLRDPRDALYSAWRHREATLDFDAWCRLPNPQTLLDAASNWRFYAECWMALAGERVFRFEDYKADDRALLARAVAALGLEADAAQLDAAAAASTFEKAKEGEALYRARYPADSRVANRAGKVGDWRTREELAPVVTRIERVTAPVLRRLGHDVADHGPAPGVPGAALAAFLPLLKEIATPAPTGPSDPFRDPRLPALLALPGRLDPALLEAAQLSPPEARLLANSLRSFVEAYGAEASRRLDGLHDAFAEGSDRHADRLKALLRQHRSATSER